jgi:segregation and condensation protein B
MEVENIRGVNSDFAINRLVSFDLVREVGRKEVPGRPLLFGTTEQFLRSFGIRSLEDLPEADSSRMEEFREEAEEEVTSRLNI